MSSLGRKIARQNKRNTPEGKEQVKQDQAERKASQPSQPVTSLNQHATGHLPPTRIRQRRAGNS